MLHRFANYGPIKHLAFLTSNLLRGIKNSLKLRKGFKLNFGDYYKYRVKKTSGKFNSLTKTKSIFDNGLAQTKQFKSLKYRVGRVGYFYQNAQKLAQTKENCQTEQDSYVIYSAYG